MSTAVSDIPQERHRNTVMHDYPGQVMNPQISVHNCGDYFYEPKDSLLEKLLTSETSEATILVEDIENNTAKEALSITDKSLPLGWGGSRHYFSETDKFTADLIGIPQEDRFEV